MAIVMKICKPQATSDKHRVKIYNFFFSFSLTAQREPCLQYVNRDHFLYVVFPVTSVLFF